MATILITGGSGMIGTALTASLRDQGHVIRHLSRTAGIRNGIKAYAWNVDRGSIDPIALVGVEHIVHLAGAGIADERWSDMRVNKLVKSRAGSANLLLRAAHESGTFPTSFISASGIGYYGAVTTDRISREDDPPGTDTIARITLAWEEAVDAWRAKCRVVKLRMPIVLARNDGALRKLAAPTRWGVGAPLGNGNQWVPWVHLIDTILAYERALFNPEMHGAYNVNTGNDITNAELIRSIAKFLGKPCFLPHVPACALRLMIGEVAQVLLNGSRASSDRLKATDFAFRYPQLDTALADLLH